MHPGSCPRPHDGRRGHLDQAQRKQTMVIRNPIRGAKQDIPSKSNEGAQSRTRHSWKHKGGNAAAILGSMICHSQGPRYDDQKLCNEQG